MARLAALLLLLVSSATVGGSLFSRTPDTLKDEVEVALTKLDDEQEELSQPSSLYFGDVTLQDRKLKGGEKLELTCNAASVPAADIYWYLNGKLVQGDRQNNVYEKILNAGKKVIGNTFASSRLTIPCVDKRHTGKVECVIRSSTLNRTQSAYISVASNGRLCPNRNRRQSAPLIRFWTDSRFENIGNAIQLPCRAPTATSIAWFDENRVPLNGHPNYEVLSNGDLLIQQLKETSMGNYRCVASNAWGQDTKDTFVYPTLPEMSDEERAWILEDEEAAAKER